MDNREAFKVLGDAGFILDVEGSKVIALKLPSRVAKEVTGQPTSASVLTRLLSELTEHSDETEGWLVVTNAQNPLLRDNEKFENLVTQALTKASGNTVPLANLTISAGSVVTRIEKQDTAPNCALGIAGYCLVG